MHGDGLSGGVIYNVRFGNIEAVRFGAKSRNAHIRCTRIRFPGHDVFVGYLRMECALTFYF